MSISLQKMGKDLYSEFILSSHDLHGETTPGWKRLSHGSYGLARILINITAEKCENFFSYLSKLGLSDKQNLIILSSQDSFNCDCKKLEEAKTLINRRKLNLIKHLDMFLFSLVRILPGNTSFIGCFSENTDSQVNRTSAHNLKWLLNRVFSRLDTSSKNTLNKNKVAEMLEKSGLTIVDMTEMNGLTYFCSRKVCNEIELSAR